MKYYVFNVKTNKITVYENSQDLIKEGGNKDDKINK